MNAIWIIGTDPPCPRCALMTSRVKAVLEETGLEVEFLPLSYSDPIAQQFAKSQDREVGTAKDVARVSGLEMDMDTISEIMANQWLKAARTFGCPTEEVPPADRWSPELDTALRPFQEEAERIGFMMTPVLVINGEVRHQGSVLSVEQIKELIESLKSEKSNVDQKL